MNRIRGRSTCTSGFNYTYKNAPCHVAHDGGGVTGPACVSARINLKGHRTGVPKRPARAGACIMACEGVGLRLTGTTLGFAAKGQAPSTTCPGEVKRSMRAYVSTVPTRAVPDAAPRWQAAEGEVAPQPQRLQLLRPCPSAGRRARGVCGRCARLGGRALLAWGALP
jgi:hypothetical protein